MTAALCVHSDNKFKLIWFKTHDFKHDRQRLIKTKSSVSEEGAVKAQYSSGKEAGAAAHLHLKRHALKTACSSASLQISISK